MTFELPPLPYAKNALAPHISAETLELHHGKHHAAYVKKLNELVAGTGDAGKPLDELIRTSEGPIFNNAAQHWNHSFYWHCLSPKGGGAPSGTLGDAVKDRWGSYEAFKTAFTKTAVETFGSGWAWLVESGGTLEILGTKDADNPLRTEKRPLLACDVWEHAYYVDYRNERPKYVEAFLQLVDWDFASKNLGEPWAIDRAAKDRLSP